MKAGLKRLSEVFWRQNSFVHTLLLGFLAPVVFGGVLCVVDILRPSRFWNETIRNDPGFFGSTFVLALITIGIAQALDGIGGSDNTDDEGDKLDETAPLR